MPGQARAMGAWISTQCLTNSSWDIPGFRASSEALLIVRAPDLVSAPKADTASPAKPIMVWRRLARVTLFFEDMRRLSFRPDRNQYTEKFSYLMSCQQFEHCGRYRPRFFSREEMP